MTEDSAETRVRVVTEDSAKAPRKRSRSSNRKGNSAERHRRSQENSQPRGAQGRTQRSTLRSNFWGEPRDAEDRTRASGALGRWRALIESLGRPPVPGQETAAQRWFTLVYERAAFLAGALAVAGELDGSE